MSEDQKVNINNNEANFKLTGNSTLHLCVLLLPSKPRKIQIYIFNLHFCAIYTTAAHALTVWNQIPSLFTLNAYVFFPKSKRLYCTLHIQHEHSELQLLRLYFLHGNQIYYQTWHSKEMLLLKEHWSSSLVQRFLLITTCRDEFVQQEKTGSILTENE